MQIDQSQSTNNNTILPQHLSPNTDSFDKFQQELNKELKQFDIPANNISPPPSNNTISTNYQSTPLANNTNTSPTTNDTQNITLEQDNQSTQYLSQKLLSKIHDSQSILNIIIEIKESNQKPFNYNYPAIFNKMKFKDRSFFQSFTNNDNKPSHQIEFQTIETDFISNYKNDHKLEHINLPTRKKIRSIICTLLSITFLKNLNFTEYNPFQLSQLIQYLINYFIRKDKVQLNFFEFLDLLKKKTQSNLPALPDTYSLIPSQILIKLPFQLPLVKPSQIKPSATALHNYYTFDLLPQSYIQILPPLPQKIENFPFDFKNIFPITKRENLKKIGEYKTWLSSQYNFYGPLPSCYFDLPPPKKPLPTTYQLLSII